MSTAGKTVAASVTALVMFLVSLFNHGPMLSTGQWVQLAIAIATAVNVWLAPRTTTWPWIKTVTYVVMFVLNGAASLLVGDHAHLTGGEWINLLIAALGGIAVAKAPAVVHATAGPVAVTNEP